MSDQSRNGARDLARATASSGVVRRLLNGEEVVAAMQFTDDDGQSFVRAGRLRGEVECRVVSGLSSDGTERPITETRFRVTFTGRPLASETVPSVVTSHVFRLSPRSNTRESAAGTNVTRIIDITDAEESSSVTLVTAEDAPGAEQPPGS